MSDKLGGIRKEIMQSAGFKMLLDEAVAMYPNPMPFNPYGEDEDNQINKWKSKSSEKIGFDLCFKMITGISPEDYTK